MTLAPPAGPGNLEESTMRVRVTVRIGTSLTAVREAPMHVVSIAGVRRAGA